MRELSYELVLPAQRERVWWAWTTEEGLAGWLCRRAEVEPFVGGQYELHFDEQDPGRREPELRCQVLSIDHPRLLHLLWRGPDEGDLEAGATEVRVRLFPALDGTRLEITHACGEQDAGWDETRTALERLWINSLERLQVVVQQAS